MNHILSVFGSGLLVLALWCAMMVIIGIVQLVAIKLGVPINSGRR